MIKRDVYLNNSSTPDNVMAATLNITYNNNCINFNIQNIIDQVLETLQGMLNDNFHLDRASTLQEIFLERILKNTGSFGEGEVRVKIWNIEIDCYQQKIIAYEDINSKTNHSNLSEPQGDIQAVFDHIANIIVW